MELANPPNNPTSDLLFPILVSRYTSSPFRKAKGVSNGRIALSTSSPCVIRSQESHLEVFFPFPVNFQAQGRGFHSNLCGNSLSWSHCTLGQTIRTAWNRIMGF
jgi:hypothetical protein